MNIKEIVTELKKPLSYKWKIQAANKTSKKATCVGYLDSRIVQDALDNLGLTWKDEYKVIQLGSKWVIECTLSIKIDGEWIHRSDVGIGEDIETEKSAYSDAFKRSAVKWGIGRFLYELDVKYIQCNDNKKPIDNAGNVIWNLTKHFNGNNQSTKPISNQQSIKNASDLPWLNENGPEWSNAVQYIQANKSKHDIKSLIIVLKERNRISKDNVTKLGNC